MRPVRSFLEVDEFQALLDAARELDREPSSEIGGQVRDRKPVASRSRRSLGSLIAQRKPFVTTWRVPSPRLVGEHRATIATLGLGGFRISELCRLLVWQVDLARGRFKLTDAKTEKGVREVEMTLFLRDVLLEYAAQRVLREHRPVPMRSSLAIDADARRSDKTVRSQLARSVERANANRTRAGLGRAAGDHATLASAHVGDVRGARRSRPERIADQIGHTTVALHILGLRAGPPSPLCR